MHVRGEKMKKVLTLILTIIFITYFVFFVYSITNTPDKGIVTGKVWTKNAKYLVVEKDGQSGFIWVSWSVYFDAENGDIYDTECDCIVGKP